MQKGNYLMSKKASLFLFGFGSLVLVATLVVAGLPYAHFDWVKAAEIVGDDGSYGVVIPSSGVVGAIVEDVALMYEPGVAAEPTITLPVGKTLWVLGVDASGQYYKVVWANTYAWLPVSAVGPNFDAVWNGTPLPTVVVD